MSSRVAPPAGLYAGLFVAGCLATAITYANGAYADGAFLPIVAAFVIVGVWFGREIVCRPPTAGGLRLSPRVLEPIALVVLLAMQLAAWNDPHLLMYAKHPSTVVRACQLASIALLLTYVPSMLGWREPSRMANVRFAVLVALVFVEGVATVQASPTPSVDVWAFQQQAAQGLLHGKNPYTTVAVPNTDPDEQGTFVPYVYPPMQALVSTVSYAVMGDVRYAMIVAFVAAGLAMRAIARAGGGRPDGEVPPFREDAPTLFVWLAPCALFILEQAWVDPVQLALASLALCAEVRGRRRLSVVLFGFLFTAKQSMFWFAPLAGFAFRWSLRQWVVAGVVAASTVLPFAVWDFKALKFANVDFLSALPPRDDALSFVSLGHRKLGWSPSARYGFFGAATLVAVASLRARGAARFAVAAVATYLVFFAFNKWAYANYYFMAGGLAALAAATALADGRPRVSGDAR